MIVSCNHCGKEIAVIHNDHLESSDGRLADLELLNQGIYCYNKSRCFKAYRKHLDRSLEGRKEKKVIKNNITIKSLI